MSYLNFTKPPIGSRVNITHPLAQGCLGAWLFNEGSGTVVNDAMGFSNGDLRGSNVPSWGQNRYGTCIRITQADQFLPLAPINKLFRQSAGTINNFSIVHCTTTLYTNDGTSFGVRRSGTDLSGFFGAQAPNYNGDIVFAVGGLTTNQSQIALNGTYPGVGYDVWVYTNSFNRGLEIWKNGRLISYGANKNPTFNVTTNYLVVGDTTTDVGTGFLGGNLCDHNFLYAYNRALTPNEIMEFSQNPYAMFRGLTLSTTLQSIQGDSASYRGRGGAVAGGRAIIVYNLNSRGGIRGGGRAAVASIPVPIVSTGGVFAAGTALALRARNESTSGGVVAGGSGIFGYEMKGRGGSVATGSAIVSVEYNSSLNQGALAGGSSQSMLECNVVGNGVIFGSGAAFVVDYPLGRGGATVGGTGDPMPGSTSAFAAGGALYGGTAYVTWFIADRPVNFGITVGGKAINIRRGSSANRHIGIAYAMKNENIIKTRLAQKQEKTKIFAINQPQQETTPTLSEFRLRLTAQWCTFNECTDNVLPQITINRQNIYLPPKTRDSIAPTTQIASSN